MSPNFKPILVLLLLSVSFVSGDVFAEPYVPEELRQWEQWVLKDREYRNCPFYFDRTVEQASAFVCSWPGELELTVDAQGARFSQRWTVYAQEQWVGLPGATDHWPDEVTVNDRGIEVVARNEVPSIRLGPGNWRISGQFEWDERPGVLRVPAQSGLVALAVDGKPVVRPEINGGSLFLGERQRDTRERDSVRTVVHRLVVDDVPTRLITRLQVDVSGSVREAAFGPILPEGFVPIHIDSPLPARLEADGKLRLQVRPGRWIVTLVARGAGVETLIKRPAPGSNLATDEIWSYRSNDQLRVSAVEGLEPVDPSQAEVPGAWQSLPAFRMSEDASFSVTERSRGVVSASNELVLNRTMWLDFDGGGFVVKDTIAGTMRTDWRLDMAGPYALLSATEGGQNLLITAGSDADQSGVEVRQSNVSVEAIGRANSRGDLPVTGWDTRFTGVAATLNLPPGHKLLMAPGVDRAAGSWMSQWRLLDFFLVLIITIAVWRLFGVPAGLIALGGLALSFHEINAPAWLWLNLLIAIALMRVAPVGRLRQMVSGYQTLSALALVIALVPFVAGQLRLAIYPQLESQLTFSSSFEDSAVVSEPQVGITRNLRLASGPAESAPEAELDYAETKENLAFARIAKRPQLGFSRYAANAIVQAGPGIPVWRWNAYSLSWSGPVGAEQSMRLIVMPRWFVSLMRIVAVGLLLLFAAVLAAEVFKRRWKLPGGLALGTGQSAGIVVMALLAGTLVPGQEARAEFPDAGLLLQLEQRLLEAPDCVPRCAEIVAADVDVGSTSIRMTLSVHAMQSVAIPLPGSTQGWRATTMLLNGTGDARVVRAGNNSLWLHVAPGRHTVTLRGPVPAVDSLELPFPTPPRVISVNSEAWFVAGIKDRRLTSGSLQLTRLQSGDDGTVRWESSRFPAFARVERVMELDIDWRVRTTVHRIAPTQGALTLDIPLLAGESIVSGEFTVIDGRVLVSMNPSQQSVSWTSNLPLQSPLILHAGGGTSWQELWHFAVGNTWNATFDGIPESNTSNQANGVRVAVFHPRNGEDLTLSTTRPTAVEGSTLAFDSVNLNVAQGSRTRDVTLQLNYRSTRGSQHVLQLPEAAEVTSVVIDGRLQTLRADEGKLGVEILPGNHTIGINWRESGGAGLLASTPVVDIGAPASNINLTVTKSRDRWLLAASGPKLGPAVLYWSELAALIVFALILGRINYTPLRTRHWVLLGLGFSTFSWSVLALVVVWLLLCGVRQKSELKLQGWRFNLVQVVIAAATVTALLSVVIALPAGLLGTPDMHIAGHNSYGNILSWFADGSDSVLPVATVVSVPMWVYKVLILVWALWLSFALLRWLPGVWQCFSSNGYWQSGRTQRSADAATESAP